MMAKSKSLRDALQRAQLAIEETLDAMEESDGKESASIDSPRVSAGSGGTIGGLGGLSVGDIERVIGAKAGLKGRLPEQVAGWNLACDEGC